LSNTLEEGNFKSLSETIEPLQKACLMINNALHSFDSQFTYLRMHGNLKLFTAKCKLALFIF